jgi:hypothetical protein
MLKSAGVDSILIDQFDYASLFMRRQAEWSGELALDSGSYRAFKKHLDLSNPRQFARYVQISQDRNFSLKVAIDVIGEAMQSLFNWDDLKRQGRFMPVWCWGTEPDDLRTYLRESELFSDGTVGIGGLVPVLRQEGRKRDDAIALLEDLCKEHPNRFHIFGACRVQAINRLAPHVRSLDSSIWLSGRKRRELIFIHSQTGKLHRAPVGAVHEHFGCAEWTGEEISIQNARNIQTYFSMAQWRNHDLRDP